MNNSWIRYFDRTYQQIKSRILTDLAVIVPEITDHTESNPWVKMLSIFSAIIEMLGYYVDNAAREAHLATCRLYWTAVKIARYFDYRVHAVVPASADITFVLNNPAPSIVTIPAGTIITTSAGFPFFVTQANATIAVGEETVTVAAIQYEDIVGMFLGTTTGIPDEVIILPADLADSSATVYVNGIIWTGQFTLGYSIPSDQHYVQTVTENGEPCLIFGDDVNGAIPAAGANIDIDYRSTMGAEGNVPALAINTIVTPVTVPSGFTLRCENRERASGGQGIETLDQLKSRIPKSLRTLRRCVTEKDYTDVTEMYSGVAKAGVKFECGKLVEIYVYPVGGGIASGALLTAVNTWLDDKKMITTKLFIQAAGEIHLELVVDINVLANYPNLTTAQAVKDALVAFMAAGKQKVKGQVQLSDLYQVIEETTGVANSNISLMRPVPYARPLTPTVNTLNWTRVLKVGSTSTMRWSITMVSGTQYDLIQNGSYVGTFTIGVLVNSFAEIDFTVLAGTYSVGDSFEFWTYPYYGTLTLVEPSVPISLSSDITVNATGGI